ERKWNCRINFSAIDTLAIKGNPKLDCKEISRNFNKEISTGNSRYAIFLQRCIAVRALIEGKSVHAHIIKAEEEPSIYLLNSLITMYAKCSNINYARHVFDKMSERDVISWNAMIASYSQNGFGEEALYVFRGMQLAGMKYDKYTFVSVVKACASLADVVQGKQVYACVIKYGLESDLFVASAFVDMHAKCGSIKDAR
ncbi:hypothetical protein KI387_032725, partial [Taxus chinensis]